MNKTNTANAPKSDSGIKVVVVEDDELIRELLRINLKKEGFSVSDFGDCEAVLSENNLLEPDLYILDIVLPGMSGIELLKRIRSNRSPAPVMIVSVKNDIESKLNALNLGADDYMVKPFNIREVIARSHVLIRRHKGRSVSLLPGDVAVGAFSVNPLTRLARTRKGEITLSEKEINLLRLFFKHPNRILSRDDILEEVWGMDADPTPRTVDNFIVKFRKLFETQTDDPRHFITVRSEGYIFKP